MKNMKYEKLLKQLKFASKKPGVLNKACGIFFLSGKQISWLISKTASTIINSDWLRG